MKKIHNMIKDIKDELCGACKYAECYIIYKNTKSEWARMYAEMADDELDHASSLYEMGGEWAKTFAYLPEDAKEEWEKCGAKLAEKTAEVRLLLSK